MLKDAYDLSFYEFDDEKDPKEYGVLLCDVVHGRPPMKPAYIGIGWYWYYHGIRYAAGNLSLPTTHGWDSRFVNGYPYITAIKTTAEEARAREPVFREKIKPFLEDFDGVWDPMKKDLLATYKAARESRGLMEWDDIRKLSNPELLSFFLDFAFVINRKEGEVHFFMLMAAYYISGLFQEMWRTMFGVEPGIDPSFHRLMSGFEAADIIFTRDLWTLGRKAVDAGLEDVFKKNNDEDVLDALKASEAGRQWSKAYHEFLLEHGWRADRMHAYDYPTWLEKPSIGMARIKFMMSEAVFPFDANRERVNRERQEAEAEIVTKIPEAQRPAFGLLMKAAQKSGYWSEDHGYYCDLYIGAMGRWILSEFGRRFAEAGCIDDAEDVHYLHPNEIRKAAIPMGRINLRPYVERRKKQHSQYLEMEPAPFFGDISLAQSVLKSDPTLTVSTQLPIVREELKADLYGAAGAPGFAEGIARVILSFDQLSQIKPGEILVAPGTSASWTVVFSVIKALVTDGGGALSHPVIMAREFGVPCVSGCVEATQKIKTGQKIRVDGDRGVVFILDK
ncbi:MAG: PEP-utilizing enzyme [Syntrophorhabdales bacterium]|jgi:phosphohistidine swiveling domain-containing protein